MSRPILSPRWTRSANDNAQRTVVITPEAFGQGFDVVVLPAVDGVGHDAEFTHYRVARAYAERLAQGAGWALVDHAGDGDRAA